MKRNARHLTRGCRADPHIRHCRMRLTSLGHGSSPPSSAQLIAHTVTSARSLKPQKDLLQEHSSLSMGGVVDREDGDDPMRVTLLSHKLIVVLVVHSAHTACLIVVGSGPTRPFRPTCPPSQARCAFDRWRLIGIGCQMVPQLLGGLHPNPVCHLVVVGSELPMNENSPHRLGRRTPSWPTCWLHWPIGRTAH